jgi:methionine biosynthesis protein MetW
LDYNKYWQARKKGKFRQRYAMIAEWVEPGSRVLDIGCGDGALLHYLQEHRDVKGVGVDISEEAVNFARSLGVSAFVADVLSPEFRFTEKYDYVVISEVLEHLSQPETLMLKVRGHVHKGVIISIPNTGFYKYRLRLLFGSFPLQWVCHPGEHLRYWTVRDFVWWSRQLGYRVKAIRSSNGLSPLDRHWPGLWGKQVLFLLTEED